MKYRTMAAFAAGALAASLAFWAGYPASVRGESGGATPMQMGAVDSYYKPDAQTAAFRSALAAVDTLTTTAILATTAFQVANHTTITVGARFSASSQTCQIQLAYVYKIVGVAKSDTDVTSYPFGVGTATGNTIKGYSPVVTLTPSSSEYEASYYPAPDYFFDSGRAVTIRILLITKPSSGTVSFWVGS